MLTWKMQEEYRSETISKKFRSQTIFAFRLRYLSFFSKILFSFAMVELCTWSIDHFSAPLRVKIRRIFLFIALENGKSFFPGNESIDCMHESYREAENALLFD